MKRVVVVLLMLVAIAPSANADPAPPTFAVDLRSRDKIADKVTAALNVGLRAAGGAKGAKYAAKGTAADMVKAIGEADCLIWMADCAVVVGAKLGVDYMFVGEVESRGDKVTVMLSVINVAAKQRAKSLREHARATIDGKVWAKTLFGKIVDTATGQLAIYCSARRGEVWIDGAMVTSLYEHRATLNGLALGRHKLEIRAAGHKPHAEEVLVDAESTINVLLD